MTYLSPGRGAGPDVERVADVTSSSLRSPESVPERACRVVTALVAAVTGISMELLFARQRSTAPVAAARQLAIYLAHVGLGLPQADVAQAFNRDRSTVAHACRRIEDMRDREPFDRHVARLEACVRWAVED